MNIAEPRAGFAVPGTVASGCPPLRASVVASGLLFLALVPANAQKPPLRSPLHIGFTRSSFSNLNPTDAEAAFMIFARTLGQQRGYDLVASARVFDSVAALEAAVRTGDLHVIVANAWEYLQMDIATKMEPVFVHLLQGKVLKEYVLLTRRGSGLNTVADLRGKDVLILASAPDSIATTWLQSLLLERGLGAADSFLSRVETVPKPSAAVLPVFFGAKSACIVDRQTLHAMVELNPQLNKQLAEVAASEPYLESITFITRDANFDATGRRDLLESMAELHLQPAGRQILALFRIDQIVPFKEEYLGSMRALRARLEKAQTVHGTARASSAPDRIRHPEARKRNEEGRP